jgi:hypothetical protein
MKIIIGERIEPTSMHGFSMTPTYIMRKNLLINLAIYKTRSRICGTKIASKKYTRVRQAIRRGNLLCKS